MVFCREENLDKAHELTGADVQFQITWRPFELNPDMPKGGLDRRAYRSRKFGSWEYSQTLDAQVTAAGKQVIP